MTTGLQDSAQAQLRRHIERIERMEEEKRVIAADISDEFKAATASGFDVKIMRQVLKLRRADPDEVKAAEAVLDTYLHALGMLNGTPLGDWSKQQDAESTISINGGPAHPMSVVKEAVELVKRGRGKRAAAGETADA